VATQHEAMEEPMKNMLVSAVAVVLVSVGCSAAPEKTPPEDPVVIPESTVTPQTTCGGRPGVFTCAKCDALCGPDFCTPLGNGCCQCS
jgi:hypothetical protein